MPSRRSSAERSRIRVSSHLLVEQSQSSTFRRSAISDRSWNAQIDLRARAAPDIQFRACLAGPLPHPAETVVAGAAGLQDVQGDAAAIVANSQPEEPVAISNLRFDVVC